MNQYLQASDVLANLLTSIATFVGVMIGLYHIIAARAEARAARHKAQAERGENTAVLAKIAHDVNGQSNRLASVATSAATAAHAAAAAANAAADVAAQRVARAAVVAAGVVADAAERARGEAVATRNMEHTP